ncbi:MAG: hypothetical protein EZS28_026691 [Streblomastix strix]|uniref:C2 domain-containing protein n=1 Tax=Streblomastix strix TaxID=222440 RepID=A0A5J4V5X4_9EUKA|nr:MAG: hypothetical protein EZS28_026691 [Streblomastix strix]
MIQVQQIEEDQKEQEKEDQESKYVKGVVQISNISVRDLPQMDLVGKTDPYVLFKMGIQEKQTSVAKETLNYDYKDEQFDMLYDKTIMQGKKEVEVEVWDYDSVGKNDLIGIASFDILPSFNNPIQVELFLQQKKKEKEETIKSLKEEEIKKKEEEIRLKEERRKKKREENAKYVKGIIKFSKIAVYDLPKMDIKDQSDPYVLIRMGEESEQTTIARNSQSHEYLNEEFMIEYDPVKTQVQKEVDVEVWDYDKTGFDDLIGAVSVDV